MVGKICGTGSYVPPMRVSNNELAQRVETSDEWIRERTGIAARHIVTEGQDTVMSMAVSAGGNALSDAGISPEAVDMLIVSTTSADMKVPGTASRVQMELGTVNAVSFDMNAACSGYVFAYNTAQAYIASGMYKTILIIGVEQLSSILDWTDRNTCILFGDGAGAAVIQASEGEQQPAVMHTDGKGWEALYCRSRHVYKEDTWLHMDGPAVFKFAVRRVPEVVREVLAKAGMTTEDVDYFLFHQANSRIMEAVARRLKTDISKFPMNMQEYGNTSSASIGILMDEMNRRGLLKRGQKLVIAGFGAGLSWGASLIEY